MFKKFILITVLFCFPLLLNAQGGWSQVAEMPGLAREQAIAFGIGNFGYLGLGENNTTKFNDIWKYNPDNNTWTQIATFPAGRRSAAVSFVVDDRAYITTGTDSANSYRNDLWEYYPTNNEWTQKASFPGTARANAVAFASLTKGYVGTGYDGTNYKNDFWEYNPANNTWSQIENFPGTARVDAFAFSVVNNGYVGTGYDGDYKQDFWEYNTNTSEWTQKANYGGEPLCKATAVALNGNGYVFCGANPPFKDNAFEYNTTTNQWTEKSNFPNGARRYATSFVVNNLAYIGTGYKTNGYTKDLWLFDININIIVGDIVSPLFIGDSVLVPYTITGNFKSNNQFKAELSDSNGNFTNPTIIGTKNSTSSGNIHCYVSESITSGNNYRIRISSTNHIFTSEPNENDITIISPWLQKANFGGTARSGAVGFTIGTKGYIGTGNSGQYNYYNDFWEYDPATNQWTQKANFGGTSREYAVGFSIGNKGYIGASDNSSQNDFWEYDPDNNQWTQKANIIPLQNGGYFAINNKAYVKSGGGSSFYEYDLINDTWTQKAPLNVNSFFCLSFSIGNKGYLFLINGNQTYEYDQANDTWTRKANITISRGSSFGFSIGNKGYLGTGIYDNNYFNDFWEYTPSFSDFLSPILLSPAYNSEAVAVAPSYHWLSVDSILSYTLQVSQSNNFDSLVVEQTGIIDTFFVSATALLYNTEYFWRVASIDTLNNTIWSNTWKFRTVDSVPPPAPVLVSPLNNGSGVSLNPVLHWSQISSAIAYNLQVSTAEDFSNIIINQIGLPQSFYPANSFAYSSTYYWRVAATNSAGTSVWSEIWNFTTSLAPSVAPVLISPLNNATNLPLANTLVWEQIQNSTGYNLEVSLNPYFTQLVTSQDNLTNTSFEISGLNYSTSYYWRVRAYNEGGASPWSAVFSFTTYFAAPLAPVLAYPLNGEIGVAVQPNFIWYPSLNAMHYELQVSTNIVFDEENIVYEDTNIVTTVHQSSALELNSLYYWRVKAVNLAGASDWSAIRSFTTTTTVVAVPPSWYYTNETGNSAQVIVPVAANPSLLNRPLLGGDAIGVFFERDGQLVCGGYSVWSGQNLNITIWGDNDQTAIKDGFSVNEPLEFKIWDAQIGAEFKANATFSQGPETYQVDGFSVLSSLDANVIVNFDMNLKQGWNQVSTSILPIEPYLPTLCSPINDILITMKNGAGLVYVPAWNINTIGNWSMLDGYKMYLNDSTLFSIEGFEINPLDYPLNLTSGWKLIPYLRMSEMEIQTALASISGSFVIVKNNVGEVFVPAFGLNTIGNMQPTQGYYIYMSELANLVYPANSARRFAFPNEITAKATKLIPQIKNTGNSSTLILELVEIENGNEVGVYNVNDELIGSGAVYNGVAAITIWGDDEMTNEVDGALNNEILNVKLLNSNNSLSNLSLFNLKEITDNTELDNFTYKTDAIYTAKAALPQENSLSFSISSIPNPTSSITTFEFYLTDESEAEIEIYTLTGELVAKIPNSNYTAGIHRVNYDASQLPNGVYNVILRSGNQRAMTMMIVEK